MERIRELVQLRPEEGGHIRSPYVFRGMDVSTWHLETSLQRLPRSGSTSIANIEQSLIRSFRKFANAGAFDDKSEWYVLAVAQHNGLPTRCLDWSSSPLVGAHFAVGDAAYKQDDGTIWCLHAGILRQINQAMLAALQGVSWVFDTRMLETLYPNLAALDKSGGSAENMMLWEPPSLDARIANQSGMLSFMNGPDTSQHAFLGRHAASHPDLLIRIVIDARAKQEVRDMLDQNNISERMLFPGLPGLCAWLKRYYSKAW